VGRRSGSSAFWRLAYLSVCSLFYLFASVRKSEFEFVAVSRLLVCDRIEEIEVGPEEASELLDEGFGHRWQR
jgi:hypothetical protein